MRFRFFRSRAFWFGVPGLVFLLWGWGVSMGHYSSAGFGGSHRWGGGQMGGEVFAYSSPEAGPALWVFDMGHQEIPLGGPLVWKSAILQSGGLVPGFRCVFIPYYAVVLAYVAVWAGLVFWRSRKYLPLPA